MAGTADAVPAAAAVATKPTKPDADLFNEKLGQAKKAHAEVMAKYNDIKAKIDLAQPNKNKDAPNSKQKRRQELIAQANEIRQKQGAGKNARGAKLDQIKRLEEQVRSRIAEQKTARGKVNFKSAEDVDNEIKRLETQVGGGMMKLVDEKKALAEISSLRKTRKNFAQFDDSQKQIDDLRSKIKEIKDSMEDPEAKALSEQYNQIQTELDAIKAEMDEAYKSLSSLRDERSKLHAEQNEKFQSIRKLEDEYYSQKKAFGEWEREQRQKARERQQAERDRIVKERRMERAQRMLAEASDPAYLEEIRRANSLLHFFDPTHHVDTKAPLLADKGMGAQPQRKVDSSGIKGTAIVSKKDREDEYLPAVKKGKKGKKGGAVAVSETKTFNCPPSVMEDCAFLGIEPPMSAADVPAVTEKVKAKLEHWKAEQPEQTKRNIEKAKKEIERIEAEEAAEASGAGAQTNGVNGKKDDKTGGDKAVSGTADAVKEVSLVDKKEKAEDKAEEKEEKAEESKTEEKAEVEAEA